MSEHKNYLKAIKRAKEYFADKTKNNSSWLIGSEIVFSTIFLDEDSADILFRDDWDHNFMSIPPGAQKVDKDIFLMRAKDFLKHTESVFGDKYKDGYVYTGPSTTQDNAAPSCLQKKQLEYSNKIKDLKRWWNEADCLLLSYPKCGSSWIRYCIELLSKRPTVGPSVFDSESKELSCIDFPILEKVNDFEYDTEKFIVAKAHNPGDSNHDKLILIIRDYKELLCRPDGEKKEYNKNNIKKFLLEDNFVENYFSSLEYFDNFKKDKILIYYEDLVNNFSDEMKKIVDFLDLDHNRLELLLQNHEEHKKTSINLYISAPTVSVRLLQEGPCRRGLNIDEFFFDYKNDVVFIHKNNLLLTTSSAIRFYKDKKELFCSQESGRSSKKMNIVMRADKVVHFENENIIVKNAPEKKEAYEFVYFEPYNSYTAKTSDIKMHSKKILTQKEILLLYNLFERKNKYLFLKYLLKYSKKLI